MKNIIVAIDIGTSHIAGVMGSKCEDGTFSISAYGTENCTSCIRRGNIFNLEETATRIIDLIENLESQLHGCVIDKIYIGTGGQSLRLVNNLITYRESVFSSIEKCVRDIVRKDIAGIIVSSQALADATLSDREKESGCALVDIGAGVTNVSVYSKGELSHMSVIPLGSNNITQDLISLNLTRTEAESLKIEYGCSIANEDGDVDNIKVITDGLTRVVNIKELKSVVRARAMEIIENIFVRINETTKLKSLAGGIIVTGCGAKLKGFQSLIRNRCNVRVRNAAFRSGLMHSSCKIINDPVYINAISVMLKGIEQCVTLSIPEEDPVIEVITPEITILPNPGVEKKIVRIAKKVKQAIEIIVRDATTEK